MTLKITIDIFSGRENPVIELTGNEAKEALERLKPAGKLAKDAAGLPPVSTLGYRGMVIEQTGEPVKGLPKTFKLANGDMFGTRLAHRAADENFEEFLCNTESLKSRTDIAKDFPKLLRKEVVALRGIRDKLPIIGTVITEPPIGTVITPIKLACPCAPLYEPAWWNVPARQPYNNCYNYATNYRTNTFAQPGRAAGAMYTALTCAAVKPAAVKDELIDSPTADNKCPGEGHLVALVIWPGVDYHWYRMNRNGKWSHKPGSTAVTNLDNGGAIISDPRTANRGGYTQFCTFMVVMHGHIKIA